MKHSYLKKNEKSWHSSLATLLNNLRFDGRTICRTIAVNIAAKAKRTNRVRKCANLFEVNEALTPQKRRNVPIVEDFGPICKDFSA